MPAMTDDAWEAAAAIAAAEANLCAGMAQAFGGTLHAEYDAMARCARGIAEAIRARANASASSALEGGDGWMCPTAHACWVARSTRDGSSDYFRKKCGATEAELSALRAERDRLKGALFNLVEACDAAVDPYGRPAYVKRLDCARAALAADTDRRQG